MKQVAITGGGGFIGLAIVRRLRQLNITVTVLGRHRYPAAEALGAVCLVGDIRDGDFLCQATAGCDTVFHVAAKAGIWGSWDDYFSINVSGTENVIAACAANHIANLIYTSTPSVVFNGHSLCGVDESTPYAAEPLCHYARTKIMAEILVLKANTPTMQTVALRPHLVWGPGDTNLIPRLLERGRQGSLRIIGNGNNKVDIAYIDNVVDAHLQAANNLEFVGSAAGQAYFISQGEPVRLWEWINDLFSRLSIPPVAREVSFRKAYRAGWLLEKVYGLLRLEREPKMTRFLAEQLAKSHWFSLAKARKELAYEPKVSTAEGMARLVDSIQGGG